MVSPLGRVGILFFSSFYRSVYNCISYNKMFFIFKILLLNCHDWSIIFLSNVLIVFQVETMIATAESLVGPYVWGIYDLLVLPPSSPYGGMENPCLTFVTPTLLVSIIHHCLSCQKESPLNFALSSLLVSVLQEESLSYLYSFYPFGNFPLLFLCGGRK